jgi:transposase, IS6 family
MRRRPRRVPASRSSFAGFRFPPDVITIVVRWYLRYGLSYRDVEELLAERGITVDHVSVYGTVALSDRLAPTWFPCSARSHAVGGRCRFVTVL